MLGIIAGSGQLPQIVARNFQNGILQEQLAVVCLKGFASKNDFAEHISEEFSLGKVGAILNFLKQHKVEKIVICGGVTRPDFKDISVDVKGAMLLTKILAAKLIGDDALLRIIADYIESHGFTIMSPVDYVNQSNIITTTQPSQNELNDIAVGFQIVQKLGEFDIAQSLIIENGVILGVEAAEGTQNLIKRCADLRKSKQKSGILIKSMKPTQDPRLDTPVIGIETIKSLSKANISGIALHKVLILEMDEVIKYANQANIFIHYIP